MKRYKKAEIINSQMHTGKKPIAGKMLEYEIEAMLKNEEPIQGGSELIYTRKRDGVMPAYNIRTDALELAITAADEITMAAMNKRIELAQQEKQENQTTEKETIKTETKEE